MFPVSDGSLSVSLLSSFAALSVGSPGVLAVVVKGGGGRCECSAVRVGSVVMVTHSVPLRRAASSRLRGVGAVLSGAVVMPAPDATGTVVVGTGTPGRRHTVRDGGMEVWVVLFVLVRCASARVSVVVGTSGAVGCPSFNRITTCTVVLPLGLDGCSPVELSLSGSSEVVCGSRFSVVGTFPVLVSVSAFSPVRVAPAIASRVCL